MKCIFCQIINSSIPSYKIAETNDYLAIMDIFPLAKGHVLIIPKKHTIDFIKSDLQIINNGTKFIQNIAQKVKHKVKADGITILTNNEHGQKIKHLHFHIIPRFFDDGWDQEPNKNIDVEKIYHLIIK